MYRPASIPGAMIPSTHKRARCQLLQGQPELGGIMLQGQPELGGIMLQAGQLAQALVLQRHKTQRPLT
jgi:hypothetical protein